MPFAYYERLSARDKATYRRSDEITVIALPRPEGLWPFVQVLREALAQDDRSTLAAAATRLTQGLLMMLDVPPVRIEVLAVRPTLRESELHGLYTNHPGRPPRIRVWMRTARQARIVAFRTFLRTLLHEIGHHLDYTHLKLAESFHTEGFFRRESSLFHQLVPEQPAPLAPLPARGPRGG
jgi:hypothetical protein